MINRLIKLLVGTALGILLGVSFSYVTFARADVGAIFDTINRAYFVALSGNPMTIGTAGSDTFNIVASGTPVASVASNGIVMAAGKNVRQTTYVPTPAATPAAANAVYPGLNIVPTAAANTVVQVGPTISVGDTYIVYNSNGTNAVRLYPAGSVAINGATANKYVELAAGASVRCTALSATVLQCNSLTTTAMSTPA